MEEYDSINFIPIETKLFTDVDLDLELGPHPTAASEIHSVTGHEASECENPSARANSQRHEMPHSGRPVGPTPPKNLPQKALHMTSGYTT